MKQKISVIIITYNRKLLLERCITSILNQDFKGIYEVIIIDNGSSDDTKKIIQNHFRDKIKYIQTNQRYTLTEAKQLAINNTDADIVAFTDDDCTVSRNWLNAIAESAANYDIVSGPVLPSPEITLPRWWKNSLNWMIGINLTPTEKFMPLGSNIAFKKNLLSPIGSENIEKNNNLLPYIEDYYRIKNILRAGASITINKNMAVYHWIPKERLKLTYLLKRSYLEGKAWANFDKNPRMLLLSIVKLLIDPIRLFLFLEINYLFREIVNISYIFNFLDKKIKLR